MVRNIMVQGTASHVGKSWIAAGLCRLLYQKGLKVAPFKAQNMALNSFVTPDGGEIGRSQALQAFAAGVEPHVDMNPILLKPKADAEAQVIVRGKPVGDMSAWSYRDEYLDKARAVVEDSIERLRREYDVLVIEGAGSPAEVNLKDKEIVNMTTAELAEAAVLLVADIDRGGVFASLVGTLELLPPPETKKIAGLIINKFRGDISILEPGLDFLEKRTGKPILGVIPYADVDLAEEDSVSLMDERSNEAQSLKEEDVLDIAIIRLPRISNFTDFDILVSEPTVEVRYVANRNRFGDPDVVIIPGTKNTIADLIWLREMGFDDLIRHHVDTGGHLVGICGGYQMLGQTLLDPEGWEDEAGSRPALGFLPLVTRFNPDKTTHQVKGSLLPEENVRVDGYEIHMGVTRPVDDTADGVNIDPMFAIKERSGDEVCDDDGHRTADGRIWGTYLHGVFDTEEFRSYWINSVRRQKGLSPVELTTADDYWHYQNRQLNLWADELRGSLDLEKVFEIMNL